VMCGVNHLKYCSPVCSDMMTTVRKRTVKVLHRSSEPGVAVLSDSTLTPGKDR
jgi:hypothetical protein